MVVINNLLDKVKKLDENIKKIMYIGFKASFVLCIIATFTLFTYETIYSLPNLFYAGILLLQASLMFSCTVLICAIGFDTIKNQLT